MESYILELGGITRTNNFEEASFWNTLKYVLLSKLSKYIRMTVRFHDDDDRTHSFIKNFLCTTNYRFRVPLTQIYV